MQRPITRGASANSGLIFHVFAQDSTSTSGAGKASVAYSSWSCRYIRNGEAISGAITPQDITTIGTYAAPTANTNIRIKAVDNTNMIGIYEVQIHADWVNTTNSCQSLTIYLTASGVAVLPIQIPLIAANMQDTVRLGLTALPNAAADAAGGLPISDAGGLDLDAQRSDVAAILVDTGTTLDGKIDTMGNYIDTEVAAIKAKTDNLPSDPADASDIATAMSAIAGYIDTEVAAILAAVDTEVAAIKSVTDAIGATGTGLTAVPWNAAWDAEVQSECADAITAASLSTLSAAQVNAEVVDALATDTYAEPGQGTPGATISLAAKIGYIYKFLRNRKAQTATTKSIYSDDATTVDHKCTVADDGTTYSETEMTTGP